MNKCHTFSEIEDISTLKKIMLQHDVKQLYAKKLSPNDNSKKQIYLGGGFEALNLIPNHGITTDRGNKASITLSWLDAEGQLYPAPCAQLILYPKYPEVRMSDILKQTAKAPSSLITSRDEGRILFLGIRTDGMVIGHVTSPNNAIRNRLENESNLECSSLFIRIPLNSSNTKQTLIQTLHNLHDEGWIDAFRLNSAGTPVPCRASNCGGYTLEGKLSIRPNSRAEPDYLGREIKQHGVTSLNKPHSGSPITLMTPEPTAGVYKTDGIEAFLRKYGYPDQRGREDRINFGGIFRNGIKAEKTGLTLTLTGYDEQSNTITSTDGGIALLNDAGIKLEDASTSKAKIKRRSQFRIKPSQLSSLYHNMEHIYVSTN